MGDYRIINADSFMDTESFVGFPKHSKIAADKLDYQGAWRVKVNSDGYGMAHKVGIIKDVIINGKTFNTIVHFAVPVALKEKRVPIQALMDSYQNLGNLVSETLESAVLKFDRIGTFYAEPSDSMKRELEELLSTINV